MEDVRMLLSNIENDVDDNELKKTLFINGGISPKQIHELMWIYRELKRLKGGYQK